MEDGALAALTLDAQDEEALGFALVKRSEVRTLSAKGVDYRISVRYDSAAQIPEGARLIAREILPGTDEYAALAEQARASLSDSQAELGGFARYFDITITKDGEKIEPAAPVTVTIAFDEPVTVDAESDLKADRRKGRFQASSHR